MSYLKSHPLVAVLIGVGVGVVFGAKIRALPVVGQAVSKIPAG